MTHPPALWKRWTLDPYAESDMVNFFTFCLISVSCFYFLLQGTVGKGRGSYMVRGRNLTWLIDFQHKE